jgi:hypothetical protein
MVDTLLFIFVGVLAVSMAVIGGFVSATASWQKWAFAVMGILSVILIVWQGVRDSREKEKSSRDQQELKDQIKQLLKPPVAASPDDIKGLRSDLQESFARLEKMVAGKSVPKQITPPPPVSVPPVVEHVRFSSRRVASTNDATPYALQVVIQTDTTMQPVSLALETDAEISEGKFFIAGQAVMMNMRQGLSEDKHVFLFSFGYPQFTPESPIVVTLFSKSDLRVTALKKWQQ